MTQAQHTSPEQLPDEEEVDDDERDEEQDAIGGRETAIAAGGAESPASRAAQERGGVVGADPDVTVGEPRRLAQSAA